MKQKNVTDIKSTTLKLSDALKVQNAYPIGMHISPKRLAQWTERVTRKLGISNLHLSEV